MKIAEKWFVRDAVNRTSQVFASFDTIGEAITYAKMMLDRIVVR